MKSKTSQTLYAYWNEVRKGRLAPRRFEIEPSRITSVLSETFILEKADSETYRFRLAGTHVCELLKTELRGTNFLDGWRDDDHVTIARQLLAAAQNGGVLVVTFAQLDDAGAAVYEALLLPLLHTRDIADRVLGSLALITRTPVEHDEAPGARRLLDIQLVWPDGKPHSVLASPRLQTPFHPHVRNARIVRSERRQFRVYEGGLGKQPADKH